MKNQFLIIALLCVLTGCDKEILLKSTQETAPTNFTTHTISAGKHSSDKSTIKQFSGNQLIVNVRFDSSAIYQSQLKDNQADINKIVGFSEGANNHIHSARIGWNWDNNALRLYAYAYVDGERLTSFLTTIAIGAVVKCSIQAVENNYIFTVNNHSLMLPRTVKSEVANGYWQYPYFGGDEVAPHNIYISMQYL